MWFVRVKYQWGGCNPFFSERSDPTHLLCAIVSIPTGASISTFYLKSRFLSEMNIQNFEFSLRTYVGILIKIFYINSYINMGVIAKKAIYF